MMSHHLPPSSDIADLFRLAEALLQASGFLPAHLKTAGAVVAVILAGRELGIPPMSSLRSISLIQGKVIIAADQQRSLMRARGAKLRWVKDGTDCLEAVLEVTLPGESEPHYARYTWAMAECAGLVGKDTWRKHPAEMLRARASSVAGKQIMPEALSGCYVPGELDDIAPEPQAHLPRLPSGPVLVLGELDDPQAPKAPAERPAAPQGVVVPITSAQRPPEAPQGALEAQLGVPPKLAANLRACKTHDDLLAWYRELLALKVTDPGQRREIWKTFTQKAHALKADPNVIAKLAGGAK
jgi:hypothetical protein